MGKQWRSQDTEETDSRPNLSRSSNHCDWRAYTQTSPELSRCLSLFSAGRASGSGACTMESESELHVKEPDRSRSGESPGDSW